MRTVYLGTSEFAAEVLRVLAASPHRPALVVTRPDRPRGRGRKLASPPVLGIARELGIDTDQPESVNDGARARAHRRRRARRRGGVRVRRADQGAAALRAPDAQRPPVAAARAGGAPPRSSGRSWPATSAPACASCASPPAWTAGRWAERRGADRPPRHLRDAGRAPGAARRRAAGPGAGHRRRRSVEQDEAAVPPTPRRSPPRTGCSSPDRPADRARARRARAHAPHRSGADRSRRRAPRRVGGDRAARPARRSRARASCAWTVACRCSAARRAPSALTTCSPPGASGCPATPTCAACGADARWPPGCLRRASAPTPSCGACSSRTPTPIAPFTPRPAGPGAAATGRSRWRSPTGPSSAGPRSTTSPRRSPSGRPSAWTRRCWPRCGSG